MLSNDHKVNQDEGMRNRIYLLLSLLIVSLAVPGCSTITSTDAISVSANQSWILLPINNLSTTPRAGENTKAMVETQLRMRGVESLQSYITPNGLSLVSLLDSDRQQAEAVAWGQAKGIRYGVTGTIHEWHYKSGPDKEPAVGLSLKLIDLTNEKVIWQATTSRTGWGYSNLSSVANKAVIKLLNQIVIDGTY